MRGGGSPCAIAERSATAQRASPALYAAAFHGLLEKGVYLPPSPFETAFLSTAHTRSILKKALKSIEKVFKKLPAA